MKTLELQFLTQDNKTVRVAVDEPAEPIDTVKVKNAMAQMLGSGVLVSSSGTALSSVKGARLIEQNITEYTLA
ncbi:MULTISPECIES: DUF2922 domain-containing protein [Heyndrickxia]|jgi:hypothetical protein|uniref:Uncharacterized protein n=1 Tax=Heyndrickxia coagulans TaxID=1398 RepID=A0A133KGT3_HEYCO|nr:MULTISPECIES: DUF2922 domain-containing protein [Heyndrickxia]NWN95889.1 DUF2922 domain-containing protein [Bacillus sp. (in: firmicutes)]APB38361.1 hypothetical protein BIZ35_17385 [Heyndrickxia coagulans]AVD55225.1 DUF2922 domain-containing protein [Heyndrickxia coagulans]AWP36096.1 DUF2922 domain-containing protein [Heyndrickxia coagulans]KGT37684.1 hypothetical protein P421_14045 [Heyndrickxia coagulans P38]